MKEIPAKWWMRMLCFFGIHWAGYSDGGGMGDAYGCDVCGRDNYSPCLIIHDRAKGSEVEVTRDFTKELRTMKECDHIYYPVSNGMGGFLGQECVLCGKFNSVDEVIQQHEEKSTWK